MAESHLICPHCGKAATYLLPVEPEYDMPVAALYLGMTLSHLKGWLARHPEVPRVYRKDNTSRLHRLLGASWVQYIRNNRTFIRPEKGAKLRRRSEDPRSPHGIAPRVLRVKTPKPSDG